VKNIKKKFSLLLLTVLSNRQVVTTCSRAIGSDTDTNASIPSTTPRNQTERRHYRVGRFFCQTVEKTFFRGENQSGKKDFLPAKIGFCQNMFSSK